MESSGLADSKTVIGIPNWPRFDRDNKGNICVDFLMSSTVSLSRIFGVGDGSIHSPHCFSCCIFSDHDFEFPKKPKLNKDSYVVCVSAIDLISEIWHNMAIII